MRRTPWLCIALFAVACGTDKAGTDTDAGQTARDSGASAADTGVAGAQDTGIVGAQDTGVVGAQDTGVIGAQDTGVIGAQDTGVVGNPDASTASGDGGTLVCVPPPGGTGNSKNVGAACTAGGGECRGNSFANLCSIDLDPMGDNFCIHIGCRDHATCGEDACCTGRAGSVVHACVPKGCLVTDPAMDCPPIP